MSCFAFSPDCVEALPVAELELAMVGGALIFLLLVFLLIAITETGPATRAALRDVMVQKCCGDHPNCWCRSAETCLHHRCGNCDMPIDDTGKALYDDFYATGIDRHAGPCPICGGPMRKP